MATRDEYLTALERIEALTDAAGTDDAHVVRSYVDALTAELAEHRARRTLGGPARPIDKEWANAPLPPPPSASDPAAPALRRARRPDTSKD